MRRIHHGTGKFLSEAFIIASIKPQSEERLFIELFVAFLYKFGTCSVHQIVLNVKTKTNHSLIYTKFAELVVIFY